MAIPPYLLGPNAWASLIQQQQQVQVQVAHAQAQAAAHAQAQAQAQAAAHAQAVAAVQAQLQAQQAAQVTVSSGPVPRVECFSEEKLGEKGICLYVLYRNKICNYFFLLVH